MPDPESPSAAAARLAAIVASSDAAIYSVDREALVTSWNRAAELLYGYLAREMIGRSVHAIIPEDRRHEEGEILDQIWRGDAVQHHETVRRRKDGALLDVALIVSPIRGPRGEIVGASTIARDLGARAQIESSADQVRLRLAAVVESSDDAIISKDLDGIVTSWNRAAERMYGFTAADAIGQSIHLIVPDDRRGEEAEVLRRIFLGETVEHFETVRRRKDGTLIPISLTVSPVRDTSGRVIGASKIARDVSESKRAVQRDAFLAEMTTTLSRSLDYETTLRTVAHLAVPSIADWCTVDLVAGDGTLERVAVAHVDPAKVELAKTIRDRYDDGRSPYGPMHVARTGTPVIVPFVSDEMIVASARGDTERIRLARSLGLVSFMVVPLVARAQTLGALTLATAESGRRYGDADLPMAQEIGLRAALAVENARAYNDAQVANRLKDEFLATLSHELRTPLNAILGYARLLQSGMMPPDRQARALATVERNATALTQIVEDVLDVSRIISGKVRLNIQPVELPQIIRGAVDSFLPAAEAKRVRIQTVLDSNAGPVSGDPDRIQQIVWNLVSNAVKFTPKGGLVQVRLQRVNSHVEIVVSDTGIGIRADFVPHVFERFRQAESGTTREHGGLGLGLAIVRHLVELHGGTVHATSGGDGEGATFRVALPLMIVHPTGLLEERRVHPGYGAAVPVPTISLDGLHILAVDDDRDAQVLVREILEGVGARVTTVESAALALEQIEAARPDLLLADLGLPGMDGFELIARLRQLPDPALRDIPAAAVTAYARSEDRVQALASGFQIHLAKPVDPAELVASIAALVRRNHRP